MIILLSCATKEKNPKLAIFDGGSVTQDEYIARYLKSTESKPDDEPTVEKLNEFVSSIALMRISLLEAKSRKLEKDTTYLQSVKLAENSILYEAYMTGVAHSVIADSIIQKFYNEYSPQYEMKYILRVANDKVPAKFKAESKDTINWLYKKLQNGADFEELAKKYSHDGRTKSKGGNLGYLIVESLGDAGLRAAMTDMKKSTFSEPIKGLAGYYILYKGKKRDVPVPPFEEVKERIWNSLIRTRKHEIDEIVNAKLNDLKFRLHFTVDEKAVNKIKRLAGWKPGMIDSERLDFGEIAGKDIFTVIARYDGGFIRAFELFPAHRRKPRDEWGLNENIRGLKKIHLLAQYARELWYLDKPELSGKLTNARNSSLRVALFEIDIQRKVTAGIDSIRANSTLKPAQVRKISQEKFNSAREEYETFLKQKYNFEYISSNFDGAIEQARKQKELQYLGKVEQ